jgi:hypothetical protein
MTAEFDMHLVRVLQYVILISNKVVQICQHFQEQKSSRFVCMDSESLMVRFFQQVFLLRSLPQSSLMEKVSIPLLIDDLA